MRHHEQLVSPLGRLITRNTFIFFFFFLFFVKGYNENRRRFVFACNLSLFFFLYERFTFFTRIEEEEGNNFSMAVCLEIFRGYLKCSQMKKITKDRKDTSDRLLETFP